jgi:hypothetical protein
MVAAPACAKNTGMSDLDRRTFLTTMSMAGVTRLAPAAASPQAA